jgi:hypothetical protein
MGREASLKQAVAEKEFDPKRWCWIFYVTGIVLFPPASRPVLGDLLNNLRAALDHLAWQLVLNGSDQKPKNPEAVQFPLYTQRGSRASGKGFRGNVGRRLPGVSQDAVAFIERCQPYARRRDLRPLALLVRLSNDDKHRAVVPVLTNAREFTTQAIAVVGGRVKRFVPKLRLGSPVYEGAEILRVWTAPRNAQVEMKAHVSSRVSLETGDDLVPTLDDMGNLAERIVRAFL